MDLHGKVALVTGGGSGIGEATVKAAARAGARVVVVDIAAEAAARVAAEADPAGEAVAVPGDIASPEDVERITEEAVEAHGRVDVLVNNAGILRDSQLSKMERSQWDSVLAVNLCGTAAMTRAVAPIMREQQGGSIVNIASRSLVGNFGQTNYAASKAGVVGFTKSIAIELGPDQVNVNAIAPGYIETPIMREVPDEVRERAMQAAPLRRTGEPADVAATAVFLASDAASYITGQCVFVCGGRSLGAALEMW